MPVYGPSGQEELYHWKYTRRYRKNGKWRYIYPNDALGIKEIISTKVTGSAYNQHEQENAEEMNRQAFRERDARARSDELARTTDFGKRNKSQEQIRNLRIAADAHNKYEKLKREANNVYYDYRTKSIKGVSKDLSDRAKKRIARGLRKIADWLS